MVARRGKSRPHADSAHSRKLSTKMRIHNMLPAADLTHTDTHINEHEKGSELQNKCRTKVTCERTGKALDFGFWCKISVTLWQNVALWKQQAVHVKLVICYFYCRASWCLWRDRTAQRQDIIIITLSWADWEDRNKGPFIWGFLLFS